MVVKHFPRIVFAAVRIIVVDKKKKKMKKKKKKMMKKKKKKDIASGKACKGRLWTRL
ncbi:MAG: hypothetical protein MMC33_002455 [Icmadophila ericetorum]|nr:hypothetical protein [Icmadophila ericetorum]